MCPRLPRWDALPGAARVGTQPNLRFAGPGRYKRVPHRSSACRVYRRAHLQARSLLLRAAQPAFQPLDGPLHLHNLPPQLALYITRTGGQAVLNYTAAHMPR